MFSVALIAKIDFSCTSLSCSIEYVKVFSINWYIDVDRRNTLSAIHVVVVVVRVWIAIKLDCCKICKQ